MSRTKKIERRASDTEPETPPDAGPGEAARQVDTSTAAQELENIALELPRGAIATLYKYPDVGTEKEWCGEFEGAMFGVPLILERFGPGRYIAYFRAPDDRKPGKMIGAGSRKYSIAKPAAAAPVAAAGLDTTKLLASYAELIQASTTRTLEAQDLQQKMQLALLKSMTERPADTGLELLKTILPALLARPAATSPDLGALITLADRLANRSSPTAAMKETLELLEKARELAGGDGEGEPAWMRVAAKALDAIGRAVTPRGERPPPAVPAPAALPAPAPAPGSLPAGGPEVVTLPATAHAIFHFLAPHMPALIRHAELDHDPSTYAGMIFDQLAAEYLVEVRDYIGRPDFLDLLEANFPAVRGVVVRDTEPPVPVREWFKDLRDDLLERIREALEPPAAAWEVH
jgi:hypothetical protein